ncbi:Mfa1 family fimbria major subunit [Porphyromonas cangingivalis]|uniref:Mfa1 family fimbria major subunit n=1 Tax=Porphyromonas cangingivalis TaxID=36874 RepID=UPI00051DEB7E|nr:Mfa1 family fimbria major subunit [Porphyromonas cangingivalis]KGL49811.1 hypothetical protein HQ34_03080 [Porphyromonas cangingivalis]
MKLIRGLVAILFILLPLSCKQDILSSSESKGEKAYMAFKVGIPSVKGKSSGRSMLRQHLTDSEESNVKAVYVVLYDKETDNVVLTKDLRISSDIDEIGGDDVSTVPEYRSPDSFVTVGIEVPKHDYKVLVFINPIQEIRELTTVGRHYSAILDPVDARLIITPTTFPEFVMSNAQGPVEVRKVDLHSSTLEAEKNPVTLAVDRMLAKLSIKKHQDGLVVKEGVKVKNINWSVDVTNKKSYLLRKLGNLSTGVAEKLGDTSAREQRYAVDMNFDEDYSAARWQDLSNVFKYRTDYETSDLTQFSPIAEEGQEYRSIYIPENTMAAGRHYPVSTTSVIFAMEYYPANMEEGKTWVSYKDQYFYSYEVFKKMINDINKNEGMLPGAPEGFVQEVIQNAPYEEKAQIKGNVKIYYKGRVFYRVPIQHFGRGLTSGPDAYGYYGIVRNNEYTVNLKAVLEPGKPFIPTPDPEDPEPDKQNIVFNISVEPWTVRKVSHDL